MCGITDFKNLKSWAFLIGHTIISNTMAILIRTKDKTEDCLQSKRSG